MSADFPVGHVKKDAESDSVAVRSDQPADGLMAWMVVVPTGMRGAHWAPLSEVQDWPDVG
jgi:hypothetical protein